MLAIHIVEAGRAEIANRFHLPLGGINRAFNDGALLKELARLHEPDLDRAAILTHMESIFAHIDPKVMKADICETQMPVHVHLYMQFHRSSGRIG